MGGTFSMNGGEAIMLRRLSAGPSFECIAQVMTYTILPRKTAMDFEGARLCCVDAQGARGELL
jgi:hypothetical protein